MFEQRRRTAIGPKGRCPSPRARPPAARAAAGLAWALALTVAPAFADGPKDRSRPDKVSELRLANGGRVKGELQASDQPEIVRWQGLAFVSPFDFDVNEVGSDLSPAPAHPPRPIGDFCFELAAGDVLFGSLAEVNERQVAIDAGHLGRLSVDRSHLHRIYRWHDGADLIYLGPNGLEGWHEPPGQKHWNADLGQPQTKDEGAAVRGDFGLPERASIEFEISWDSKPDFVFALGVDESEESVKRAFRFEAWGGDLVVQRELERAADLSVLQEVAPGPGRAHLQAHLDQTKGRILVSSAAGKPLADLEVKGPRPKPLTGLYLANVRGDVRLEWLRIGRWNGEAPREVRPDQARVHRTDGSITYGRLNGYRADTREFALQTEQGETRVSADQISSVFLSSPKSEGPSRTVRAVYQDGARISGELVRTDEKALTIEVPGADRPWQAPRAGLRSFAVIGRERPPLALGAVPHLRMDGVFLAGRLVDGRERPDASCLVWHPLGSRNASPLRAGASGKIVFRETPTRSGPNAIRAPQNASDMAKFMAARRNQLAGGAGAGPGPAPRQRGLGGMAAGLARVLGEGPGSEIAAEPRSLFLRDGDVIPCAITGINEKGVTFRTSMSKSSFVPHEKVQAVELAADGDVTVHLTKSKRERLLTLIRMRKGSPPEHLVRSRNGDYLRGRVVLMDDQKLRIETRLETKDIPRDRVSKIIWLHTEFSNATNAKDTTNAKDAPRAEAAGATRVQVVRGDGVRITFVPEEVADGAISGKSDVLGPCRVPLSQVDELLFGREIERAATQLAYAQWKLQNAPEPASAAESDGPGGTASPLVGRPAPDFTLEPLEAKARAFQLADQRGKVVVLDFWATWCGPCVQSMPLVEKAVGAFSKNDVILVAVNLQETPGQIRSMLERRPLDRARVVLDKHGAVAAKYQANAIPQTVVIDRAGTVARLFVGGGPKLEDQLREAIQEALGQKPGAGQ